MEHLEMQKRIDEYIYENAAEILLVGAKIELAQMIISILKIGDKVDLEITKQILKCYDLISPKVKDDKRKKYSEVEFRLSKLERELNDINDVIKIETVIQEVMELVSENGVVIYDKIYHSCGSYYGATVKEAEECEMKKIVDQLGTKAYKLLIELEYRNMQLGKYTIKKESLYDLMSKLLEYDKLFKENNFRVELKIPSELYEKIRDIILIPEGYVLNQLWNSCAREGMGIMVNAICDNKSQRCFTRGYNIFFNALQRKDIRTNNGKRK